MKKVNKNNRNIKLGILITIISIFFISIGYSAFRNDLSISNIKANISPLSDIRINSFAVFSSSSQNDYSNFSNYNKNNIYANVHLTNASSWVKYVITVVNLGNEEAGIANFISKVLPDELTFEIEDYQEKNMICDDDDSTVCTLNALKTFYIIIKYKDGASINNQDYSVNLELDFQKFYNVTYENGICNNCPNKAIATRDFSVNLTNCNVLNIKMNEVYLIDNQFSFNKNTGLLTIYNVSSNIEITNTEYTLIDYIESTGGTQYIDTGYIPNKNTTVVFDGMVISGDTALFGSRESRSGIKKFTAQFVSDNIYRASFRNKDFPISDAYLLNNRYVFKMNINNFYINNDILADFSTASPNSFTSSNSLYLMALNTSNAASNFGKVRVYSFKIFENGVLIKSFLPILDSNNVPCLYETFGKEYYYNKGEGDFIYEDAVNYSIINHLENIEFSNGQTQLRTGSPYTTTFEPIGNVVLPTALLVISNGYQLEPNVDYSYNSTTGSFEIFFVKGNIEISELKATELDYFVTNGNQFVDTGHVPTINTKVVFTHIPMTTSYDSWMAYFGSRQGDTGNINAFYVSSGTNSKLSSFVGTAHIVDNITFTHTIGAIEVISLSSTQFTLTVNGVEKLKIENNIPVSYTTAYPIALFGRYNGSTYSYGSSIKFVSFQIYEGQELVKDFIPVLNENGITCLLEMVENEYYYNIGTGSFLRP